MSRKQTGAARCSSTKGEADLRPNPADYIVNDMPFFFAWCRPFLSARTTPIDPEDRLAPYRRLGSAKLWPPYTHCLNSIECVHHYICGTQVHRNRSQYDQIYEQVSPRASRTRSYGRNPQSVHLVVIESAPRRHHCFQTLDPFGAIIHTHGSYQRLTDD